MNHDRICAWLGLPTGIWPPDHYRLLGVTPGPVDPAQLEIHVFERMETVRRYQLLDPDQATEAMNRLAQAFVCLTNEESKKAYDAETQLAPRQGRTQSTLVPLPVRRPAAGEMPALPPIRNPLSLQAAESPPSDSPTIPEGAPAVTPEVPTTIMEALETLTELAALGPPKGVEAAAPVDQTPEKVDPIYHAARSSDHARRGLNSKRALYQRITVTRRLLRSWTDAGPYLGDAGRRLTRPVEATELIYLLGKIRAFLKDFPPLLGVAGQPGYLVKTLARQQVIVPTYQTLLASQRETLARDWEAGLRLLQEHRDYLRLQLRIMRRRSFSARMGRPVKNALAAHPGLIALILGILILGIALWRAVYLGAMTAARAPIDSDSSTNNAANTRPRFTGPDRAFPATEDRIPEKKQPEKKKEVEPPPVIPPKPPELVGPLYEPPATLKEGPADAKDSPSPNSDPANAVVTKGQPRNLFKGISPGDKKTNFSEIRGLAFLSGKDVDNPEFVSANWDVYTPWIIQDDGTVCRKLIGEKPIKGRVTVLTGGRDTGVALGADEEERIFLWKKGDFNASTNPRVIDSGTKVRSLAFSIDGTWLGAVDRAGAIKIYSTKEKTSFSLSTKAGPAVSLAFMANPARVVAGHKDGKISIWDIPFDPGSSTTIEACQTLVNLHEGSVSCLAASTHNDLIATGGHDGAIRLLAGVSIHGFRTFVPAVKLRQPGSPSITFLGFSNDNQSLAAAYWGDRSPEIWNIHNSGEPSVLSDITDVISCFAFSPDDRRLLVGHGDGTLSYHELPKR